ncbi:MAG TPA: DUF4124 domain-containing protein [Rubrivivax sp.]|nr:DUF4124 domain-containing protein [Rubrivivax sp.]
MHSWRYPLLLTLLVTTSVAAQVYKHVGPDGKVFYSDKPQTTSSAATELKQEIRARAARPEDDPMHAAMSVYGNETMVETFYRFCRDSVPESEPAVREARDRWNARHRQLTAKKIVVLHDLLPIDQLRKIAAETEATHKEILGNVLSASPREQASWCKAAPGRFEAPEVNPARNPTLVKTLESYKPKSARQ